MQMVRAASPQVPGTAPTGHALPWRTDRPTRPAYLRDASAIETELYALAAAHPSRARVVDIGDSLLRTTGQGGHDILALVLGAHPDDPAVPRVLYTAGIHPRELANPSLLTQWARRTLEAAARGDAASSALLGERTIALVPIVNPDALDIVTSALASPTDPGIWWRGNANPAGAVDLNRNFDGAWGAGDTQPGEHNYHGPAPSSEPETRSIESFGASFHPAAVYDWHSPGGVVLQPSRPATPGAGIPDAHAAAELVSRAMGYPVRTSDEQWAKSVGGTVKDWARERLGAVSLTIETGSVHHQTDAQFADTRTRAFAALNALSATVDGRMAPSPACAAWAHPAAAPVFIPKEHLDGTQVAATPGPPHPDA